tara:strand:+ start:2970 stop:7073 length:4104 start_codon:yes stop_codon:yes gene_type:complete
MATLDTILNIRVEGTDSMVKLKTEIDKTAKELKELQKEGKKAGDTQAQYTAKVVTAETKLKGLRGELNKGKTELIKNAKAAGDNSKSYNSLTKANAKYSQELRKLADPMGKNSKAFTKLSGKIRTNTDQLKKMDAQMGRHQRNVGNYKQSLTSVATGIGAVIIAFTAFQRVLSTFVDFQFQMKQVGVISGATTEQLQMLTDTAKDLGSTTAFTAGEVAALQTELAKLGFDATEINIMTESVLNLAFAFDKDLAATGETVAIVLNSYKMEATEAARVTDILATAFASTSLDLEKFNTAFPKVGAISKQLGFSLEGTTAMLGALTNAGLEASTAGTSLKSIFLELANENSKLSQRLGGSVKSIDQLLPALDKLYKDGTDVADMLNLTNKRSVAAFATLASGAPEVQKLTKSFEESSGTAEKMSEVMRDSLKGSLDETMSAAGGFVIELMEALEPALNLIIGAVGLLFSSLSFLVENFKSVAIGAAAYGVVLLATAINSGTLTTAMIGQKIALYASAAATWVADTATKAFSKSIYMNPIGIFIGLLITGISLLWDWGSASSDAAGEQNKVTEAVAETATELTELEKIKEKYHKKQLNELATLKLLTKQIQDRNLTDHERMMSLKEFNKLAGTNIRNLKDEARLQDILTAAMESTIDAIKRRIILESSSEELTVLLEQQLALDLKIEESLDQQAENTKSVIVETELLTAADIERKNAGVRNINNLILAGKELGALNTRGHNTEEANAAGFRGIWQMKYQVLRNYSKAAMGDGYMSAQLYQQESVLINANITALENKSMALENTTLKTENLLLSENAQHTNALALRIKVGDVLQANNKLHATEVKLQTKSDALEGQINTIYEAREKALNKLVPSTKKTGKSAKVAKTAYQKLAGEIGVYDAALKKSVTEGEIEMKTFVNSEEAKAMSVEDRNKRIAEIEQRTADKVAIATGLIKRAKADLKVVDDKLAEAYEIINLKTNVYINSLKELAIKTQGQIDIDKRQLVVLQELEDAGADVAKQRITLALKIAKTELDLALKTAEASDLSTDAQIANIKRLQGEIEIFEELLEDKELDPSGFLNKVLFGSNEDGEGFTGEDLINSIQIGLGVVSDMMSSFNELQNQKLTTRLGVITKERDAEVELYKNSAQYEIDTDEERSTKIETIKKKHDDEMLALKIDQFKKDKAFQKAQAVIGGATAIMNILKGQITGNPLADAIIKGILIAATIATTIMQIATINAQPVPTAKLGGVLDDSFFADGGMVVGKSHKQGGEKFSVGGRVAELEGGEAVINKRSTAMFKPMLSKMNVAGGGKKFGSGGMVFADGGMSFDADTMSNESFIADALVDQLNNQQVLLVEADVTRSQKAVETIQSRVSF